MIEAERVTLAGRLTDVSLRVGRGEMVALVGPNGAGKSSLLALCAGDLAPDSGLLTLDGHPLRRLRPARLARLRAVLPQSTTISFPFTVTEIVEMGQYGRPPAPEAVAAAMNATEVAHLADREFPTLSGGEQARAALARVLVQDAPALLLDEPTAALDLRHQEQVMRIAAGLRDQGRAVLVVLHDLNLAAAYADRLALLRGGRIVADGPPAEVLDAALLSEVYACSLEVRDTLVIPRRPGGGRAFVPKGGRPDLPVRSSPLC